MKSIAVHTCKRSSGQNMGRWPNKKNNKKGVYRGVRSVNLFEPVTLNYWACLNLKLKISKIFSPLTLLSVGLFLIAFLGIVEASFVVLFTVGIQIPED